VPLTKAVPLAGQQNAIQQLSTVTVEEDLTSGAKPLRTGSELARVILRRKLGRCVHVLG